VEAGQGRVAAPFDPGLARFRRSRWNRIIMEHGQKSAKVLERKTELCLFYAVE